MRGGSFPQNGVKNRRYSLLYNKTTAARKTGIALPGGGWWKIGSKKGMDKRPSPEKHRISALVAKQSNGHLAIYDGQVVGIILIDLNSSSIIRRLGQLTLGQLQCILVRNLRQTLGELVGFTGGNGLFVDDDLVLHSGADDGNGQNHLPLAIGVLLDLAVGSAQSLGIGIVKLKFNVAVFFRSVFLDKLTSLFLVVGSELHGNIGHFGAGFFFTVDDHNDIDLIKP